MSATTEPDIALDYLGLIVARTRRAKELLADYDRDVHRPAMDALRQRCAETGHRAQDRSNGAGWHFRYCGACGMSVETVGPDEETK